MSIQDFILDKRVVQRNILKGIITRDELEKTLAQLPDMEANAEACTPDAPEEEESTDEAE